MSVSNVSQYSQSSIYTTHPPKSTGSEAAKANDASFSVTDDYFTEQKKAGIARNLEKVENDKGLAKEMVDVYRNTPDRPMFNLEEALSSPGGLSYIQDRASEFNVEAQKVSEQREELYSSLNAQNYSNADIFKSLMEFTTLCLAITSKPQESLKSTLKHKASGRK